MGRSGVTYLDVEQAAIAIEQTGEEPTIDRVREFLGTGSKSTLAPLLKRWKAQLGENKAGQGFDPGLLTAVKNLQALAGEAASQQIESARTDFVEREAALQAQLADKDAALIALQQAHDALVQIHTDVEAAFRQLGSEHQQIQSSFAAQRAELVEVRLRLEEAHTTVEDLKRQLSQSRQQVEHYQQAVAEERRLEREQVQQLKAEWHDTREDWTRRMAAELASRKGLKEALDSQSAMNQALERRQSALQTALEMSQQRIEDQRQSLADHEQTLAALRKHEAEQAVCIAEHRTAREHLDQANAQLTDQLGRLEHRLGRSEAQADRLLAENQQLREANLLLEAQLHQLGDTSQKNADHKHARDKLS